jgi:exodeoxyribonuclease VII large subunit
VTFRTHYYFELKDKETGAILNCAIWITKYRMCGVEIKEGQEVIIFGEADIYPQNGKFTFKADTIELYGEGALKVAFEKLRKQLEKEGLFAPESKRALPKFPKKIGLITSKTGDAIVDFRTNLGIFGFEITFIDSRVEGVLAVEQLISSIRTLKNKDIDVLVLVRGGGSLESLQAYNNEMVVRELASFPKPVLTGIGHEKDITLADLVADRRESTPTGAAKCLNVSWELLINRIRENREKIRNQFETLVKYHRRLLTKSFNTIKNQIRTIIDNYNKSKVKVNNYLAQKMYEIENHRRDLHESWSSIKIKVLYEAKKQKIKLASDWSIIELKLKALMKEGKQFLEHAHKILSIRNPEKQLELGYSIVRSRGKVVKNINTLKIDDSLTIQLSNGSIESLIKNIANKK